MYFGGQFKVGDERPFTHEGNYLVSTLGGCGGLQRTDFKFPFWGAVVVLKELIFNSFYFGRVWWSSKN